MAAATPQPSSIRQRGSHRDAAVVQEAERKVGAVLGDLEADAGAEVKDVALEEVVDTNSQGRPEVKKAVKIRVEHKPRKPWSR